jgi:5-aminolevulinate synthase
MRYDRFFADAIAQLREERRYRVFADLERIAGRERERQQERATRVKAVLSAAALPIMLSDTHIVPVVVGDPEKCKAATDLLLTKYGIYIQPINYPTVPRGTERLRITATPYHHDVLIDQLAEALTDVWRRVALPLEGCVIDVAE